MGKDVASTTCSLLSCGARLKMMIWMKGIRSLIIANIKIAIVRIQSDLKKVSAIMDCIMTEIGSSEMKEE
jgi:hypothetical protein